MDVGDREMTALEPDDMVGHLLKTPMPAPPKTARELAKQLVDATHELTRAHRDVKEADERLKRFRSTIDEAEEGLRKKMFKKTQVILVKTPVCHKAVVIRLASTGRGASIEVLDIEEGE